MNRCRRFSLLAVIGLAVLSSACERERRSPDQYNVVLVTLDTTRADRIGAFGGTLVSTPRLDALAKAGVVFEQAIAQAPLTLPSHASMLTGRYPAAHGVRHNGVYKLPESATTLTERLREAGFRTAAFIGAFVLNSGFGTEQGFEVYDDIDSSRYHGGRDNLYESRRSAEEVNAAVFEWFDSKPESERFFLWVHYYDPHHPYLVPEKAGRSLNGSGYERAISYMDSCIGDLVDRLDRADLLDRTILVVAGDHGESLGEHRELTHGIFLYEGAVRVPFFIRAPGLLEAGERVVEPVELVDLGPTVLDLLDLPPFEEADGESLVPVIGRRPDPAALAFAETLMPRLEYGWSELRMVRDARWKLVQAPRAELYDLVEDPGELNNLLHERADIAQELATQLDRWAAAGASSGADEAARVMSPEEEAKLRSLGYFGSGGLFDPSSKTDLPDPKDRIDESLNLTRGRELLEQGRPEQAIPLFDRVLVNNPRNHLARSSKVQALIRLKRLEEAEEEALASLAAALEATDNRPLLLEKARRTLASILWMRGKNEEAEEQYRLAIELNQDNEHAAVFGGILLGAAGGLQEAMRIVEDVLSRNPRDGIALAAKFELEMGAGDLESAYRTAQRLSASPGGEAETLLKAGILARDFKDPGVATRLFAAADERRPENPEILGHLGTALLASGRSAEAEQVLRRVHRLAPDDPRPLFYLANIALLRGDEAAARQLVRECLQVNPSFVPVLLNLARWLGDQGRFTEAEQVVREALNRVPDDEEARALLRQIQVLSAQHRGPDSEPKSR